MCSHLFGSLHPLAWSLVGRNLPYPWVSNVLWIAGAVAILMSIAFLVLAPFRKRGTRKPVLLMSLMCFLLYITLNAVHFASLFYLQLPAMYPPRDVANSPGTLTHVGDPAPDFPFKTLDGTQSQLSELRGRAVLLVFFATWCGPCKQELSQLQTIWKDFGERRDFAMIAVGRKESEESLKSFRSLQGFSFPMAADPEGLSYSKYASQSIPRVYLVSREGKILYQCTGFYKDEVTKLRLLIEKSLSGQ